MRRTTTWLALSGASLLLIVAACSGSSAGTAAPASAGAPTAAQSTAPSAAPSVAESAGTSSESPIAIPSFDLPNDDKGLEALLPDQLCGKTVSKLSFSGQRFASVQDQSLLKTLAQLGKSLSDVSAAASFPNPATNAGCKTTAFVFRIKGADVGQFRDVFINAAKEQNNTTYTTGNVGGKDVYIGTIPSKDNKTYAYFKGDALFFVDGPDEASAAAALQVMP
jgi:hypothetical protein